MIMDKIDITKGNLHEAVMTMEMHHRITMVMTRHGAEREIMRITRVPSGWLYETWANLSKTKRNATFVPYP